MKRLSLSIILFFIASLSSAQVKYCSCDSALVVDKPIIGPVYASGTPDPNLAVKNQPGVYFEKPHSVSWFTFIVPEDTMLTFDIIPANNKDDNDFLLFKDEGGNFCEKIKTQKLKPLRANIANTSQTTDGMTGLSVNAVNETESIGKHPAYSKSIAVKKGERYYLAVDNYTNANGPFTLKLNLRWPALVPKPLSKPNVIPPSGITLRIIVCDSARKPVKARLKIAGISRALIDTNNTSEYTVLVHPRQRIRISSLAPGYLLNDDIYLKMMDTGSVFGDTIFMVPIKEHQNMVLQDIEFEPEQYVFIPEAKEPLSNLLEFMQTNAKVNILIKGYVNDPLNSNSNNYDQNLSEERAKAVLRYLNDNGIDKSRMDWIGYGSKDMIYPHAASWEEQRANRRVEIEVK